MKRRRKEAREWLLALGLAVVLAVVLRSFVFEPYAVEGNSMLPLLSNGERLLIVRNAYRSRLPARGDIIIFHYPRDPSVDYVKRVIGLPGETVALREGRVYIDGAPLPEGYIGPTTLGEFPPSVVQPGTVFVLGDNRDHSEDSRYFGGVPLSSIEGHAVVRFWPLNRIGAVGP